MRQIHLSGLIFTVLIGLLSYTAMPVHACSPSLDAIDYTLEDRAQLAPVILVGTITGGEVRSSGIGYEVITQATVEVESYLKGEGPSVVTIDNFGDGADCLAVATMGMRAVFFAAGDPDAGLDAFYLGVHDATWDASDEVIETITAITGEPTAPYPPSLMSQLMDVVMQPMVLQATLAMLGCLMWLGLLLFLRRRNQRKPKAKRG